ncbi:MAG: hypothetical protein QM689_07080 [Oscillospiraceae bacterium]
MMKKKKMIMILIITSITVCSGIIICLHFSKYDLKNRLGFELPSQTEYEYLKRDLSADSQTIALKFKLSENELDSFISLIEDANYHRGEDLSAIPHPERIMDNWDLNYNDLTYYYVGFSTRQEFLQKYRAETSIYITKAIDGERYVYICYSE